MNAVEPCARCHSPLEIEDLRCAICAMVAPEVRAHESSVPVARILRCEGCGAALEFSAEVGAPRCAFCAALMRVEQPSDPIEVARLMLPFAVTPDVATSALRMWLKSLGFFRPSDLATASTLERLQPILWCGWLVDAQAFVSWSADSDAGSRQSSWAPHSGQTDMGFSNLLIPASRGLSLDECLRLIGGYDLRALVEARDASAGAFVERFDVQRSAARSMVVGAIERTAAARLQSERVIPGSRFRNVRTSILLKALSTQRVVLSAYIFAYRYNGRPYRVVVHGQDVRFTFGAAPYSIAKIALVVAGVIVAIVIVLLLALISLAVAAS